MLMAIRSGIVVLVLLIFTMPAAAAPASQGTGCSWYYADTLAMTPEYNPYADRPMTLSVQYTPPHVRGDRDFSGNGPRVTFAFATFVSDEDIGTKVMMEAVETKSDWTTANGTSSDLWFLHLRNGWKLRRIGQVEYSNGRPYVIPGSMMTIPQGRVWGPSVKYQFLDKDHDPMLYVSHPHYINYQIDITQVATYWPNMAKIEEAKTKRMVLSSKP